MSNPNGLLTEPKIMPLS